MPKKTFEQWMSEVNVIVARNLGGLTTEDLPDCCYRDWYEDGVTPGRAATRAIKMAGQ